MVLMVAKREMSPFRGRKRKRDREHELSCHFFFSNRDEAKLTEVTFIIKVQKTQTYLNERHQVYAS